MVKILIRTLSTLMLGKTQKAERYETISLIISPLPFSYILIEATEKVEDSLSTVFALSLA